MLSVLLVLRHVSSAGLIPTSGTIPPHCEVQTLGCYQDGGASHACTPLPGGTPEATSLACRAFPYSGSYGVPFPSKVDPPWSTPSLTLSYCAAFCWAGMGVGGKVSTLYAAVQDGSTCSCGLIGPKDKKYPSWAGLAPDPSKCNTPCPGDKSPACGGPYVNTVLVISCGSDVGWTISIAIPAAALVYLLGGVAWNAKHAKDEGRDPMAAPLALLPSQLLVAAGMRWSEVPGLVRDGVLFSKDKALSLRSGGGGGGGGGGYEAVTAEAAESAAQEDAAGDSGTESD